MNFADILPYMIKDFINKQSTLLTSRPHNSKLGIIVYDKAVTKFSVGEHGTPPHKILQNNRQNTKRSFAVSGFRATERETSFTL